MTKKKQPLKQGEKVLLGVVAAFFVAAAVGYVALETVRLSSDKPLFEVKTHYDLSELGKKGSALFRHSRCTSCHRAMRNGTNMGLSLDGVGSRRSREWLLAFLAEPERVYDGPTLDHGPSPKEAAYVSRLPEETRVAIATFLSELKSDQGSPSSPLPPAGRSEFIDGMVSIFAPEGWKEKYRDVRERGQGDEGGEENE